MYPRIARSSLPLGAPEAPRTMNLTWRRLLLLVAARHWLVWGACLVGGLGALGASQLMTKRYMASADVLLDIRESDPVEGHLQTPALLSTGYVATQVDIIASDRVTRKVVRALGLDTNPLSIQQWHEAGEGGTVEQYYMDALRKGLEVKPARLSNVVSIHFYSPSASYAATVANAFAKAYVDTNVELKADPARDFKLWFDARTAQARDKLEQAQSKLSKYQQEKGIVVPSDQRLDMENSRLAELSSQLSVVQGQRAESASRRDQASDQMGSSPDVLQNSLIQALRGDVARMEAKQQELARDLGRNHPKFKSSEAELASLKEKLDVEIHRVAASVGGSDSVIGQKERQIRAAVEAQKARVLQLNAQRDEAAVLRNDVESSQLAYDLVLKRLAATNLESQVQQTNVSILSEALPPVKPTSPKPLLNTALGILIGTLLGTVAAVLIELRRPRLRSLEDVTAVLSVPVLASIPLVKSLRKSRRQAFRLATQSPAI